MRHMRAKRTFADFIKPIKYITDPQITDERSKRIVELYFKKHMTQHEIAEMLSISQATVSRAIGVRR